MSYTYGFFDAIDQGGGNYDRVYTSAEFSHYWSLLVKNGVFGQPSTTLEVLAMDSPSMNVQVQPGTGWINGHYLTVPENDQEVVSIPVANPTLPRIDSVILALDNEERMMKIYLRSGSAAPSPSPVELQRDADVYELELAQITISAGAGNINQVDIKDMRTDPDRCGIVTGLIDQFDISGFLTAAQASFNEWFEKVKGQLGDDPAGNLQNQINSLQDSKLNVSDKATPQEAIQGENDSKYMTPYLVNRSFSSIFSVGDLRFTTRGSIQDGSLWALANGEFFDRTEYPELYNLIKSQMGEDSFRQTTLPISAIGVYAINGFLLVFSSNEVWYCRAYASSWSKLAYQGTGISSIKGIKYLNGKYLIYGTNGTKGVVWYGDNLEDTFSSTEVSIGSSSNNLQDVTFFKNTYVFCGNYANGTDTDYSALFYSSNLVSFNSLSISSGNYGNNILRICSHNSKLYIIHYTGTSSTNRYYLKSSTNISSSFSTEHSIYSGDNSYSFCDMYSDGTLLYYPCLYNRSSGRTLHVYYLDATEEYHDAYSVSISSGYASATYLDDKCLVWFSNSIVTIANGTQQGSMGVNGVEVYISTTNTPVISASLDGQDLVVSLLAGNDLFGTFASSLPYIPNDYYNVFVKVEEEQ